MPSPVAQLGFGNVTTGATPAGTSVVVAKPASLADGDLLVAAVYSSNTGLTFTPPAGWTLAGGTNAARTAYLYTKPVPAAGAEPSSYTWTWTGSSRALALVCRVIRARLGSPVDVAGAAVLTGPSPPIAAPSVTTTQVDTLLLGMFWTQTTAAPVAAIGAPPGMTLVGEVSTAPAATSDLILAAQALPAAGATGSRTATANPTPANGGGFLLALAPGPTVKPPRVSSGTRPAPTSTPGDRGSAQAASGTRSGPTITGGA